MRIKGTPRHRDMVVEKIDGKWLIIWDGDMVTFEDERNVKSQIQAYVGNWVAKDAEGMLRFYMAGTATLADIQRLIQNDAEKDSAPQKFVRFLEMWSDCDGTINVGIEVAEKSGIAYCQARLGRAGSNWMIQCVVKYPDQKTSELLAKMMTRYVELWSKGDTQAMFQMYETFWSNRGQKGLDLANEIKSCREAKRQPLRLMSSGKPCVASKGGLQIPYVVETESGREEYCAHFKVGTSKHAWVMTENSMNKPPPGTSMPERQGIEARGILSRQNG